MVRTLIFSLTVLVLLLSFIPLSHAMTLELVKQRDELYCGVTPGMPGFSETDEQGRWSGFHVDFCRAVAAAAIGDAGKVRFIALTDKNRITGLLSGDVDLLAMNVVWDLAKDAALGVHFAGITLYDGQGFLVRKKRGVSSALELNNATVCVQGDTSYEQNVANYFLEHGMAYKQIEAASSSLSVRDFVTGRCEVLAGNSSRLYMQRSGLDEPGDYIVLPELITREPIGPIVRQGDDTWFNVVRWTFFVMLIAEEHGVSSTNVDSMMSDSSPETGRLLQSDEAGSKALGLNRDWKYQVIKQVGSYAEVFEKTLGSASPLRMDRGLNGLWNRGGLHYAPSLQ